jgi:hypothetical protein
MDNLLFQMDQKTEITIGSNIRPIVYQLIRCSKWTNVQNHAASRLRRDWALRCISRETREDAASIPAGSEKSIQYQLLNQSLHLLLCLLQEILNGLFFDIQVPRNFLEPVALLFHSVCPSQPHR